MPRPRRHRATFVALQITPCGDPIKCARSRRPRTRLRAVRIGVLASGNGSLLEAMIAAGLPVRLALVDRACPAVGVAAGASIPTVVIERTSFGASFDRTAYTERVVEALTEHRVDLVAMAGFGTVLGPALFAAYPARVLNTHPALLPAFPGWHAVRDALAHGVRVSGCTVHVATPEVDHGPILAQEAVPVVPGDTETTLHERIKTVERRVYVQTIQQILKRGSVI
jgi:phosphoribosylglycinamide formyltransferase-1